MISKRRDDKGRVLQQGEWQEPSGRYRYKYTDSLGKRKILYSWRLTESDKMPEGKRADPSLREKERKVQSLQIQGITGSKLTVIELVERYLSLKTGVKHNTLANYNFVVNVLKKEEFSHKKVDDVKLSDEKIFLIKLQRDGRGYSSIHSIRGVLRPAFQMAVDDDLILKNPFGFELGTILVNDSQKREAVSLEDETRFLEFVKADLDDSMKDYGDEFVRSLQKSVKAVKESREMEGRYMLFEELLREERAEGKEEGRAEGIIEVLLSILEDLGEISGELEGKIREETDPEIIKEWCRIAAKCESIPDFISQM